MTCRTYRFSAITCEHHAVLYLVLVSLDHVEEVVDADVFAVLLNPWTFVPEIIFLFLGKVVIWLENGEVVLWCTTAEFVFPFAHLLSTPTEDCAVIDAEQFVRNDKVLVNAYNTSESFAVGAGSDGRIEREHLFCRLFELNAVGFEAYAETVWVLFVHELQQACTVTLVKGCLGGVEQAASRFVAVANCKAVYKQIGLLSFLWGVILYADNLLVQCHSCETLLKIYLQLFLKSAAFTFGYWSKQQETCPFGAARGTCKQVLGSVFLYNLAAYGGVCLAYARI